MAKITVYHKGYCPYCRGARQMLEAAGLKYTAIDVTDDKVAFAEMVARSGRRTVPQIFFGEQHIGGFDDLQQYVRENGAFPSCGKEALA